MACCTLVMVFTLQSATMRNIHPNKLICVLSFTEFCTCWVVLWYQVSFTRFICYFEINESYFWTMKLIYPDFTMELAIKHLIQASISMYDCFQNATLFLNMFFCIDLYLTFINPFYPNGRRLNWYFAGTIAFVLILLPFSDGSLLMPFDRYKEYDLPLVERRSVIATKI